MVWTSTKYRWFTLAFSSYTIHTWLYVYFCIYIRNANNMQTHKQQYNMQANRCCIFYIVFVMMEVYMYIICKSNSCETQQVFIHVYIAKIPYIYYSHIYTCKIWKKIGVLYCRGISESNIYAWLTMHCITMVHSISNNKQHKILAIGFPCINNDI